MNRQRKEEGEKKNNNPQMFPSKVYGEGFDVFEIPVLCGSTAFENPDVDKPACLAF